MIAGRFSKFRVHLVATALGIGISALAYGSYRVAIMIKSWANASPRHLHEEMEEFLRIKEREARLKALEAKEQ